MNFLKEASLFVSILSGVFAVIAMFLGGFVPLFAIAFGVISVFYLGIYIVLNASSKTENKFILYVGYLLFAIPIIWAVFDLEGFTNFLLQGITLDMK